MPRFVILFHAMPAFSDKTDHWDFMLEDGDDLATWALTSDPSMHASGNAIELPRHRLKYLDYEGPVSGDRGAVAQWDVGHFEWKQRNNDVVRATLLGAKLTTDIELTRRRGTAWTYCM